MKRPIHCLAWLALWLAWGVLPACAEGGPPLGAADFLKQSMSRYQALTSFQAQCTWNETFGGVSLPKSSGQTETRSLVYVSPNRFKVITSHSNGLFIQTGVSDGKHLVEYSRGSQTPLPAERYAAPASIAKATSMQMQHFMFCGTLLYQFFGGPDNLPHLADTGKMPIAYGPDTVVDGEPCKTVRLYATGQYGQASFAISVRDHLVRRITFDSAPLMALLKTQYKGQKFPMYSSSTTEEYRRIIVDQPVASAVFDTTLPKGLSVTDMGRMGGGADAAPPVAMGSLAPDFTVTRLSSKQPVTLSSQRGSVVLLDFWATWCPPCRKSLPETQKLSAAWGAKGLTVMTISDESQPTIAAFLKSNHYDFPAYRDGAGSAGKAYKVSAIPTLVVIDKAGHLVAYLVGLQEPETVAAALKKAGLPLPERKASRP